VKRIISVLFLILSGCSSVQMNGETRIRIENISSILNNCSSLIGKTVTVKAEYKGWDCPSGCKNPGITRSDSCIVDKTGCIYLMGTGKLNPIIDKNKIFLFRAEVETTKDGTCYLKVVKSNEVR